MVLCKVLDGTLVMLGGDGRVLWQGKPRGARVEVALPIEGTDDCIVLSHREERPKLAFDNLFRWSPDGKAVWIAALPDTGYDAYVAVAWKGSDLFADSWSCFRVRLDPDTGAVLDSVFTKQREPGLALPYRCC